jgi:hypothetical protein
MDVGSTDDDRLLRLTRHGDDGGLRAMTAADVSDCVIHGMMSAPGRQSENKSDAVFT